jgi:SAM-dependent methyltransferase
MSGSWWCQEAGAQSCREASWQDDTVTDESVIFDQAAGSYDRTRALPAETAEAQTAQLASLLAEVAGPVLEIGVGTGRIAVPLARTGIQILGVDLSAPMLAQLAAKGSAVAAAMASATRLPVRAHSVGAVIACHVLHLIADWQQAVEEALRVLRPGGLLLAARGRADGSASDLQRRIRTAAGVPEAATGLDNLDGLDQFMRERGAQPRHLPPIPNPSTRTAEQFLRHVRDNTYSWTWAIPEAARLQAVETETAWMAQTLGDPRCVELPARPVSWRSYRLP